MIKGCKKNEATEKDQLSNGSNLNFAQYKVSKTDDYSNSQTTFIGIQGNNLSPVDINLLLQDEDDSSTNENNLNHSTNLYKNNPFTEPELDNNKSNQWFKEYDIGDIELLNPEIQEQFKHITSQIDQAKIDLLWQKTQNLKTPWTSILREGVTLAISCILSVEPALSSARCGHAAILNAAEFLGLSPTDPKIKVIADAVFAASGGGNFILYTAGTHKFIAFMTNAGKLQIFNPLRVGLTKTAVIAIAGYAAVIAAGSVPLINLGDKAKEQKISFGTQWLENSGLHFRYSVELTSDKLTPAQQKEYLNRIQSVIKSLYGLSAEKQLDILKDVFETLNPYMIEKFRFDFNEQINFIKGATDKTRALKQLTQFIKILPLDLRSVIFDCICYQRTDFATTNKENSVLLQLGWLVFVGIGAAGCFTNDWDIFKIFNTLLGINNEDGTLNKDADYFTLRLMTNMICFTLPGSLVKTALYVKSQLSVFDMLKNINSNYKWFMGLPSLTQLLIMASFLSAVAPVFILSGICYGSGSLFGQGVLMYLYALLALYTAASVNSASVNTISAKIIPYLHYNIGNAINEKLGREWVHIEQQGDLIELLEEYADILKQQLCGKNTKNIPNIIKNSTIFSQQEREELSDKRGDYTNESSQYFSYQTPF